MSRFFITEDNIFPNNIIIVGEDFNHIKNVLRYKIGDKLILCDGEGKDFHVSITEINNAEIVVSILNIQENKTEPFINFTLFQGIAKGDKMDFIIQKSVELGVKTIVPLTTDRTVVRLEKSKDELKKKERWQKIALEAAKQCNRGIIPKIEKPTNFGKVLDQMHKFDLSLIPYEKERSLNLRSVLSQFKNKNLVENKENNINVAVFIGPEGGFTEKEIENCNSSKIVPVTLGPRILRTETAALAAISIIMYDLGALD